jgi:hypothetical protein
MRVNGDNQIDSLAGRRARGARSAGPAAKINDRVECRPGLRPAGLKTALHQIGRAGLM